MKNLTQSTKWLAIGQSYGDTKKAMIAAFIMLVVQGIYSTLMAYLLNYEGGT